MSDASPQNNILTPEQKQFWHDNGYLRLEQVYTPEEVQEAVR